MDQHISLLQSNLTESAAGGLNISSLKKPQLETNKSTSAIVERVEEGVPDVRTNPIEMIRRLKKEKETRRKKLERLQRKEHERMLAESRFIEKQREEQAMLDQQKREEWRQHVKAKLETQKERREKSMQDWEKRKERNIDTPLYKRLEENYEKNILLPELQRKKEELAKKRELYRPLSKLELDEHAKRHDDLLRMKQVEQSRERLEVKRDQYEASRYATKFTYNLLAQKQRELEEEKKKALKPREMYEKKKEYGRLVKETRPPQISEKKKLELKLLIQNQRQPVRRVSPKLMNSKSSYALGRESHSALTALRGDETSYSKVQLPGRSNETSMDRIRPPPLLKGKNSEIDMNVRRPQKRGKKSGSSVQISSLQEIKDKSVDYLLERRNKRKQGSTASMQWQHDIKDEKLSMREKYERVSEKVRKLEGEAKRKEQLLIVQRRNNDVDETNEVTDMLVDAIKAKLAILEGI